MTAIHTPEWAKHAVFYQIFPDRFARGAGIQHARGLTFRPWGSDPRLQGYQGGDLYGIAEHLDYLVDLGINALYLTPIFASASNHRYHTYDYLQVDPLLGGNEGLRHLLDEAHRRDVRVVLDGVFNHASRGFWAFHHILENGGDSPYLDWFTVQGWPLRPYHSDAENPPNYEAWWNLPALPKFNIQNPGVRDYLLGVARHWLEFGIDGWRLDVADEIKDDSFWRQFRQVVKAANPQAYICGELWGDARHHLQGDMFDAVMNYPLGNAILRFCGAHTLRTDYKKRYMPMDALDAPGFAALATSVWDRYDWAINHVQLNLLDSHDSARALWMVHGDETALRLMAVLQMTLPGAPCIYYGDEIGMTGADDPDCRGAFPWHEPALWNRDLRAHYQSLTALRHAHPVLRTGSVRFIDSGQPELLLVERTLGPDRALIAVNSGRAPVTVDLHGEAESNLQGVWPDPHPAAADAGQVTLAPRSAAVWIS